MARKNDDLTFGERLRRVSDISSKDHSYPRPDLIRLSSYLAEAPPHKSRLISPNVVTSVSDHGTTESFACVYRIANRERSSFAASIRGLAEFSEFATPTEPTIVFLRGLPSPQWLNVLGEKCDPNPEFYRRHLSFHLLTSGDRDYFASPNLPSTSARVFQLTKPKSSRHLAATVEILRNRHSLDWPQAESDPTAEKTASLLLSDFEHLLQQAEILARECEQGMTTLANSSILEESRRSTHTASRVQRLTIIGTIFIPLSFVCSVWGTNFKEFGSGSKPVWMLFASAAPVIILSYLIYNWDAIKHLYRKQFGKEDKSKDFEP